MLVNELGHETVESIREKIDQIDDELLELLNQRMRFGLAIGALKLTGCRPVHDISRESSILDRILGENTGPLSADELTELYLLIFKASKRLQRTQRDESTGAPTISELTSAQIDNTRRRGW